MKESSDGGVYAGEETGKERAGKRRGEGKMTRTILEKRLDKWGRYKQRSFDIYSCSKKKTKITPPHTSCIHVFPHLHIVPDRETGHMVQLQSPDPPQNKTAYSEPRCLNMEDAAEKLQMDS